jgi:hypothetical protein
MHASVLAPVRRVRDRLGLEAVIAAYAEGGFDGNMLSLCDPDCSALASVNNRRFPRDWAEPFARLPDDELAAYCKEVLAYVDV